MRCRPTKAAKDGALALTDTEIVSLFKLLDERLHEAWHRARGGPTTDARPVAWQSCMSVDATACIVRGHHFDLTLGLLMARINVDLDEELHRKVKAAAALGGVTLKNFVVATLEAAVDDSSGAAEPASPTKGRRR